MKKTDRLPEKLTIGEAYRPAMNLTEQADADAYFERLVERQMRVFGRTPAEAEDIERSNLGYYAGYYDHETRIRVERLFACRHPMLPPAREGALPASEVFARGVESARRS